MNFLVTDETSGSRCVRAGWELIGFYCAILIPLMGTVGEVQRTHRTNRVQTDGQTDREQVDVEMERAELGRERRGSAAEGMAVRADPLRRQPDRRKAVPGRGSSVHAFGGTRRTGSFWEGLD